MKKYQIVYADPPWNSNTQFDRDKKKGNVQHYPLMTLVNILVKLTPLGVIKG